MKKIFALVFSCVLGFIYLHAQTNTFPSTGSVGIGTVSPDASSVLDITSTTKGVLISRMTKAERDLITSPASGLLIYQTNSTPGFYYYDGTSWTAVSPKGVNKSLSNLTAPTAVNQSLVPGASGSIDLGSAVNQWRNAYFSADALINGLTVGRGAGNGFQSTAVGFQALYSNTSGQYNAATGNQALNKNSTGSYNTANGYRSLLANTQGNYNTATGGLSLYFNTTGNQNTSNGVQSLYSNIGGNNNTAIGVQSLYSNTSGSNNTASGFGALTLNTTGPGNTANGVSALYYNTTGSNNVAIGIGALYLNETSSNLVAVGDSALYNNAGSYNTALGSKVLNKNTTGGYNTATGFQALRANTTGSYNTADGFIALSSNTTGTDNSAFGWSALSGNTTGNYNVAIGETSAFHNTTGSHNVGIGYYALSTNTTGIYNTAVGDGADVSAGNLNTATAIGVGAIVNASNKVVIGQNIAGIVIGGYANWSNLSDGRFKENIKEDVPGLKFITKLRPVTYTINSQKLEEHIMQNMPDNIKAARKQTPEQYAKAKSKIQTGFVAQEVEKTAKEIGYNFDGVNVPQNETDNYSIAYSQFVVPLVKAVQELSKMNDDKDARISDLEARLTKLETMMNTQSSSSDQTTSNVKLETSNITLSQNTPNPFHGATTIIYSLPQQYSSAKMIVTDKAGRVIKEVNLSGSGKGILTVDASAISSGTYQYSLYVDGRLID
ncbi:MAG TPA: tail fiber domain-containing protein, partial [Parafilimonas sp.]|nr:tail fiber domain-containing protein [Parafilimonas sp.]